MTGRASILPDLRIVDGGDAFRIADGGGSELLIVADHASNRVPHDVDLGIAPELLDDHIAYDPGTELLATALAGRLRCRAVLGGTSRLVCDFNREEQAEGLIPLISDGIIIPGNAAADREARLERFHRPYHAEIARQIAEIEKPFLLSLHSFTPKLRSRPDERRPWDIGVLYNEDRRAAVQALDFLEGQGLVVGDQQPYSGKDLNYTMNRHAEAVGIPYLGLEIRQDVVDRFTQDREWDLLIATIEMSYRVERR